MIRCRSRPLVPRRCPSPCSRATSHDADSSRREPGRTWTTDLDDEYVVVAAVVANDAAGVVLGRYRHLKAALSQMSLYFRLK